MLTIPSPTQHYPLKTMLKSYEAIYEKVSSNAAIPNSNLQTYILPQLGTRLLGSSYSDSLARFDHDLRRTINQGFRMSLVWNLELLVQMAH